MTLPATSAPAAATRDDKADAARQLEAFFLRRLLAEARPSGPDPLMGGGFAGETFREMLDDQLADKMAQAGGVGLAQVVGEQLGADPAALANRPPAVASIEDLERRLARGPQPGMPAVSAAPAVSAVPAAASSPDGFILPVQGRRSSPYGMRIHPVTHKKSMHMGQDIAAPTGTSIAAAGAGVVVHAGPAGTYGNLVKIRHENGLETRYAHLSVVGVKKGDHVEAGTPIGEVGTTGRSTGPHLHFEVRKGDKALDPVGFLPAK